MRARVDHIASAQAALEEHRKRREVCRVQFGDLIVSKDSIDLKTSSTNV
jgi:hypothetical protein